MTPLLRTLSILSMLELVSVLALLINLVTVHDAAVSRALGPAHGALYLTVAVIALLAPGLMARTRIYAILPVLSGPLTLLRVRAEAARR